MKKLEIFVKAIFVQALLWLALLLAMGASLSHVAYSFNQFELSEHQAVGWLAAIGVDLGLLCLAIGVQRRKRQERKATSLWLALAFVTAISVLANVSHGVHVVTDDNLSTASFATFDWLETATMLLLAGCLPVLVFSLSEVASDDTSVALEAVQKETKRLERQRQRDVSTEESGAFPMPVGEARRQRELNADEAEANLWQFVAANPDLAGLNYGQIGAMCGRSRQWTSGKLSRWERAGAIERHNGNVSVLVDERPE